MNHSAAKAIAGYSALTHKRMLHVIEDLDDAALRERSGRANSLGPRVWCIARCADRLQHETPACGVAAKAEMVTHKTVSGNARGEAPAPAHARAASIPFMSAKWASSCPRSTFR